MKLEPWSRCKSLGDVESLNVVIFGSDLYTGCPDKEHGDRVQKAGYWATAAERKCPTGTMTRESTGSNYG